MMDDLNARLLAAAESIAVFKFECGCFGPVLSDLLREAAAAVSAREATWLKAREAQWKRENPMGVTPIETERPAPSRAEDGMGSRTWSCGAWAVGSLPLPVACPVHGEGDSHGSCASVDYRRAGDSTSDRKKGVSELADLRVRLETLADLLAEEFENAKLARALNGGKPRDDEPEAIRVSLWEQYEAVALLREAAALSTPTPEGPQGWTWIQPANDEALVERLAIARDEAVPERERENLCACAHTALQALLAALREIALDRPKGGKPDWGDGSGGNNLGDAESNGYDMCAWKHADIADAVLRRGEPKDGGR